MKKKVLCLFMAGMMFSISACSNKPEKNEKNQDEKNAESVMESNAESVSENETLSMEETNDLEGAGNGLYADLPESKWDGTYMGFRPGMTLDELVNGGMNIGTCSSLDCYYPGEEEEIDGTVHLISNVNDVDSSKEDYIYGLPEDFECEWMTGYEHCDYLSTNMGCKLYFRTPVHFTQDEDTPPTPLGVPYVEEYGYRCSMSDIVCNTIYIDTSTGFENFGIHTFEDAIDFFGDKIIYIDDKDDEEDIFQTVYAQDGDTYISFGLCRNAPYLVKLESVKWEDWDVEYYTYSSDGESIYECQTEATKKYLEEYNIKYEGMY